jgi:MFS family permease
MLFDMSNQAGTAAPWGALLAMSLTVMVSFGVILYGFSIFITDAAAGADFSKTLLSAAYGGSVVTGGLLAIPIGSRVDRLGVRGAITLGGVLGLIGMAVFATATSPWQVVVAWWLFLGPAGAMTFYEVAFVAVDQWFTPSQRPRAIGTLTLIGGLAGIIFIPATQRLVDWVGWRQTAFGLGVLVLATALATVGVALRGVALPDPKPRLLDKNRGLQSQLLGDRRFVIHTAAMVLIFFAAQGLIAHRVALFDEVGFDIGIVALWAAAASAFSLPGRWIAPLLAVRYKPGNVQALATLLLAASTVLMLDGTRPWQMGAHFVLFGVSFGAVLPLRAMTMADWFSGPNYGATMGSQWTVTTVVGASGPVVVGLLRDATTDYRLPMTVLLSALLASAVLLAAAARATTGQPRSPG